MNFLSSLKDKAVNASEAIKDKTIKTAEVVKGIGMEVKCGIGWHAGEYQNEKDKPKCFFPKFALIAENILQKINMILKLLKY